MLVLLFFEASGELVWALGGLTTHLCACLFRSSFSDGAGLLSRFGPGLFFPEESAGIGEIFGLVLALAMTQ